MVVAAVYVLYLLFLIVRACSELRHMPYVGKCPFQNQSVQGQLGSDSGGRRSGWSLLSQGPSLRAQGLVHPTDWGPGYVVSGSHNRPNRLVWHLGPSEQPGSCSTAPCRAERVTLSLGDPSLNPSHQRMVAVASLPRHHPGPGKGPTFSWAAGDSSQVWREEHLSKELCFIFVLCFSKSNESGIYIQGC